MGRDAGAGYLLPCPPLLPSIAPGCFIRLRRWTGPYALSAISAVSAARTDYAVLSQPARIAVSSAASSSLERKRGAIQLTTSPTCSGVTLWR
jgi:hypothetical protein